ncbi:MAG: hypothetical protein IKP92_03235 [Lachnospiraceae bacterium]|nr:hypothetical protein [Lachnospiraceae bacterium]
MENTEKKKQWNILLTVLFLLSGLAAIKLIFLDYTMDEEYQIVMAYRNLRGDAIFGQMWEPHQTSAFLCIGIMFIWHLITGTYTGVVIVLRIVTTLIQAGLSFWLYRVLEKKSDKKEAALLAILYFNSVPKLIEIPEFSNMQLWFFTVMVLSLMQYYYTHKDRTGKVVFLILSSVGMALEVLSYPSMLVLFPVTIGYILFKSKKNRLRDAALFIATDVAAAGVWLLIVVPRIGFTTLIQNVKNMLAFDLTHDLSGSTDGKFIGSIQYLWQTALLLAGICAVAAILFLCLKKVRNKFEKKAGGIFYACLVILISDLVQCFYWFVLRKGYEYPQIHLLVLVLCTIIVMSTFFKDREFREKIRPYMYGFTGSVISVLAVFYISDLQFYNAIPHGMLGVVFSLPVLAIAIKSLTGEKGRKLIHVLFLGMILTAMLGKGLTFKAGRELTGLFDIRGIMKEGPAKGILSDYMNCYIYNADYADFKAYVKEDDKVLIVTNMVFAPGTTPYLFSENEICHFSIVDPTSYDERLLKYWELYPEKQPNVIVVDCWYGNLQEDPENWIMQYIENDFGYTSSTDGSYIRVYRRDK